jgi:hypothetical protein
MSTDSTLAKYRNPSDTVHHDFSLRQSGQEVVRRLAMSSLSFAIDSAAAKVWKYFKDFNLWHEDLQYSLVVGEAASGSTGILCARPSSYEHYRRLYGFDPATFKKHLVMGEAVAEKLIVFEAISEDERSIDSYYLFGLNERGTNTTITGFMSYAPLWAPSAEEPQLRKMTQIFIDDVEKRWKESYIPRLRLLVAGG